MSITQTGRLENHSRRVVGLDLGKGGGRDGGGFGEPKVGDILGGSFPGATRGGHCHIRVNHGRLSVQY